nr:MAG TPA: hypothetical protein [Caudoviricetes sp.]
MSCSSTSVRLIREFFNRTFYNPVNKFNTLKY